MAREKVHEDPTPRRRFFVMGRALGRAAASTSGSPRCSFLTIASYPPLLQQRRVERRVAQLVLNSSSFVKSVGDEPGSRTGQAEKQPNSANRVAYWGWGHERVR
jgi:hypothetical protein